MSIPTANSNGIYSVKWLNSLYTGPIFTFRRSTDSVTADFYVSDNGLFIGTDVNGTGTSLTTWLSGATAYITKWWDQSTKGFHATQTTPGQQPVFDTSKKCIKFTASSTQFFNLPDNTVPSGNSNYTVIVKHGIITNLGTTGSNNGGLLGSGTTVTNGINSFSVGTNAVSNYTNYWWSTDFANQGTYVANNTVSWKYNGTNRYFYVNSASISSAAASSRNSGTTNNFIGRGDTYNNNYLDGELFYISVYNTALDDNTRILAEFPTFISYNINNTGLLHYYPLNSNLLNYATGTGVTDATANLTSISTANTKLTNGSLYFPGTANQYLKVSNPSISTTTGMTFAIWAKYTTIPTFNNGSNFRLFDYATGPYTANIALYFVATSTLGVTSNNRLTLYTKTNYVTNFTLADNNWHHYCATISENNFPTTGNFVFNVYVDGSNILSSTVASSNYPTETTSLTSCFIGQSNWTPESVGTNQPVNYFNQAVVFNRVITSVELSYLVNYPAQVGFSSAVTTPYSSVVTTPYSSSETSYPCFLEGTKILRLDLESDIESYIAIEKLKRGDLIKTSMDGYKSISFIGKATLKNPANDSDPKNRLYVFKKQTIKGMTEDLCITGEHCTLRLDITELHLNKIREHMGQVYITDDRFRCPACLDERAIPYEGIGPVTIWHFALEHDNAYWNYGVYANGLLVESCSIEHLVKRSKMILL
jgi:hypothetical protein